MIRFAFTDYGCLEWTCEDPLGRHCDGSYYNALDLDGGSEDGKLALHLMCKLQHEADSVIRNNKEEPVVV